MDVTSHKTPKAIPQNHDIVTIKLPTLTETKHIILTNNHQDIYSRQITGRDYK